MTLPATAYPLPDYPNVTEPLMMAAAAPDMVIRPLFDQAVAAGFPSPAEGYLEKGLDLNQYLVRNQAATFFFRVRGDSMVDARIHDGDLIVVDRSIAPQPGHIVLAVVNNDYTVKRYSHHNGVIELKSANPAYPTIRLNDLDELQIWGVVVGAVARILA